MEPTRGIHYFRDPKKAEIRFQENITILDVTREGYCIYVNRLGEITIDPIHTMGMANFVIPPQLPAYYPAQQQQQECQ